MLGLRPELADRHVFDHAPAQRTHCLVGHGGAPVLGEVVATPRSQDRALPLNTAVDNYVGSPRGTLPRERFSPRHDSDVQRCQLSLTAVRRKADLMTAHTT